MKNQQETSNLPTIRVDQLFRLLHYFRTSDFSEKGARTNLDQQIRTLIFLEMYELTHTGRVVHRPLSCWEIYRQLATYQPLETALKRLLPDRSTPLLCTGVATELWHGINWDTRGYTPVWRFADVLQEKLRLLLCAIAVGEIELPESPLRD